MPTSQLAELFRKPGPDAVLDYLWGRLLDRDLSPDEALALLGAVHRQLAAARANDPKIYLNYSRFMESLNRDMPLVHDSVVARWIENRRGAARELRRQTVDADPDVDLGDQAPEPEGPRLADVKGMDGTLKAVGIQAGGDSPEEPGEPEDDEDAGTSTSGKLAEAGGDGQDADNAEPEDESEAASSERVQREDGADEEPAGLDDRAEPAQEAGEASDDSEPAHAEDAEEAESPEAQETGGDAAEPEPAAEQPDDASDNGSSGSEGAADVRTGSGSEEGEWPVMEEPEPAEPAEEFEGEGGEPSPME